MPAGDCFYCHKPGHWANRCPLKSTTNITAASPPVIHCPCDGGRACDVLTSKTVKNPNRRFYKCSAVPSCEFFKWCDQVSSKSQPVTVNPTCPCGSGPCRRVTVIDGPNAYRSYFVCCIKKGFGACGFFQWENDSQIPTEHLGLPCYTLTELSESDDNSLPNIDLSSDASVYQESKDVVSLETGDKVLPSHNEIQVMDLCNYYTTNSIDTGFRGKESNYALEVAEETSHSENINNPVSNKPACQSTTTIETESSFSGCSSLIDLIEQYTSEKLHFESVSMKHVDVLSAFTGSYKILESLRYTSHNLRKELLEVGNQVKIYETKTSEFAASLQEVCGEMTKAQNKMVGTRCSGSF